MLWLSIATTILGIAFILHARKVKKMCNRFTDLTLVQGHEIKRMKEDLRALKIRCEEVSEENKKKIFYLCDGEVETCKKNRCYKKAEKTEGLCRHTTDIKHALNFKVAQNGKGNYYENTSHAD